MPQMTKKELVDVLVDNKWEWVDHKEKDVDGIAFKKEFNGEIINYHISNNGIDKATKEEITCKINSHDVYWMSRVVGYFAKVGNWNKSKLGELKDRRKGIYTI